MRVDVSEIKTFRECPRKHQISSRNRFHMRPITPNENLIFGTQMHEVLHMMYLGTPFDKILEWINKEVTDTIYNRIMNMIAIKYYEGPYKQDIKDYVILDIEKGFDFPVACIDDTPFDLIHTMYRNAPPVPEGVKPLPEQWYGVDDEGVVHELISICGSIDMIVINVATGELEGFEHKSTKNFRPPIYDLVDEQPRMYSIALQRILEDYHAAGKYLEVTSTGAIYLNQVRKLQTKFDYARVPCKYGVQDLTRFLENFIRDAKRIAAGTATTAPQPGFMKCQMCDYSTVCIHYGYCDLNFEEVKKEFEGEYEVREFDHLDEKAERSAEE